MTPGTRLGPYEILALLGAGGMGEVYRARDTRLDRIVAIKVLSGDLTLDAERRERFQREARAISALNHPHICVLHDIGQADAGGATRDYLVMEYIDGETLSARLERAPLALNEALTVAIQIASALDRAHSQGIVHRDLKPGNVMMAKGGGTKLLDFGLARFTGSGDAASFAAEPGMVSIADLSMPTVRSPLTMRGTILGTLHYMAPEQLEGKAVDSRADLFAFGALLFEMITRTRAFEGRSQASLIGAILDHHPPTVTSLQPNAPPLLDDLVSRCLAKSPDDRWQSTRDLLRQLEWIASHRETPIDAAAVGASPQVRKLARTARVAVASALLVTIASGLAIWKLWPQAPVPPAVARFAIGLPADHQMTRTGRRVVALSADGQHLVYVANQQLYLRPLKDLNAVAIAGTAGSDPSEPVFSPDGAWIAFWSGGSLKKVPTTGGTPVVLGAAENPTGMSWAGDRLLLGQATPRGIVSVPANGGNATPIVLVDEKADEVAQSPQLVANGRAVIFTLKTASQSWDDASIVVQELATNTRTVLVKGGTSGYVLPSGHLIYARQLTLFAIPFNEATLSVSGSAVPVQQDVELATAGFTGAVQAAFSSAGTLAFLPAGTTANRTLAWLDRSGRLEPATAPARLYQTVGNDQLRIAPNGSFVAITTVTSGDGSQRGADIWLWDTQRGTFIQLSDTKDAGEPVWTSDSRRVCYRHAPDHVLCQSADGSGRAETVVQVPDVTKTGSLTPDNKHILLHPRQAASDIYIATLGSSDPPRPLIEASNQQSGAVFSPDGRWIAYYSNENGSTEVYVRPFPNVDTKRWQISNGGGTAPRWSADGRELFYLDITGSRGATDARAIMAVPITASASFEYGQPRALVKLPAGAGRSYDVARDGRFLISLPVTNAQGAAGAETQFVLVQNWFEELKARVPVIPPK